MNTSTTYKLLKPTKIFFAALLVFLMVGVGSASALITQVGAAAYGYATGLNYVPISITKPSGVTIGDILIVTVSSSCIGGNTASPTMSGWNVISSVGLNPVGDIRGTVFYKIVDNDEYYQPGVTISLPVDWSYTAYGVASLLVFTGINSVSPFDITPGLITSPGTTGSSISPTGITTVTPNAHILMLGMNYCSTGLRDFTGWTMPSPGTLTEIADAQSVGSFVNVGAGALVKPTAGATGNGTITINNSGAYRGGIILALKPGTKQFRSLNSGPWDQTWVWEQSIDGGASWGAATTLPNANTSVQIQGGHTVTIGAANAFANDLTINGAVTISGTNSLTLTTTATINGTLTIQNTGSIINGTGDITFNNNATYVHARDGGTIPTATWDPTSTCLITGITSTMPTGANQAFGNFTWDCSGQSAWPINFTPSSMSVQGNLTVASTGANDFSIANGNLPQDVTIGGDLIITGGTYRVCYNFRNTKVNVNGNIFISGGSLQLNSTDASSYTGTIDLAGNLSISGGILDLSKAAAGCDGEININGNFSQTGGTITETGNATANAINFTGTTTQNCSSVALNNTILFSIASGSNVDFGTSVITQASGTSTFTIASGGTLITANTLGITTAGATGTIRVTGTRNYNSGANYEYNGTAAQVTGDGLANPSGVTISNSAGVTFSAATTMDYLIINNGAIANLSTFNHTASLLYLNLDVYSSGTWGSSSSSASNPNNIYFAATSGIVTLTPISHTYSSDSPITIPCGIRTVTVEAWGAGGAGGSRSSNGGGGGGGGGAYSKGDVGVTSGAYMVFVGSGGTNGNAGGDSGFGPTSATLILAKGGSGVAINIKAGAAGGLASSGIGTTRYSGGTGASGTNMVTGGYGGGGGSSADSGGDGVTATSAIGAVALNGGGDGGNGRSGSNGNGSVGAIPGGGGGGAYRTNYGGTVSGGAGGNGLVIISYPAIIPTITLGSNPSVCQGSTSATLSYSAITECVNKYTINFDEAAITAGFVNVESTNLMSSPITIVVPAGATPNTYNATLRVINSDGFLSSGYAITITVTAKTWTGANGTAWNDGGNWCGGVPTINTDVAIPAVTNQPTIGPSITGLCNNISISSGATVTITAGTTAVTPGGLLRVGKTVTNNAGASGIVIKSSSAGPNGSLIFSQPSLNTSVQATVEMYSKASQGSPISVTIDGIAATVSYNWQYFGIPVKSITTASPTFDGSYVRSYSEGSTVINGKWTQLSNSSPLTEFKGYEITQKNPTTIQFQGTLETGNIPITLTYKSDAYDAGQNILSNSYTAAIHIGQLSFGPNTENTIYLYNTGSFANWYNNNGETTYSETSSTPGQYIAIPYSAAHIGAIPYDIPSMSGFMVKVSANDVLTLNYTSVVIPNITQQRAPSQDKQTSDKVYMEISLKGKSTGDRMWLINQPGTTRGFDNGWDGYKITGSLGTPQLFAMEESGNYQVSTSDDLDNTDLGFQAGIDIEDTLTFTNSNLDKKYAGVFLVDLKENKTIDITVSGTQYAFMAESTPEPFNRFKIVTRSYEKDASDAESLVKIFSSESSIFVQNFGDVNGECRVYDIAGHYLIKVPFVANAVTAISNSLIPGVYIATAIAGGEKVSKQLIVR